MTFRDCIQDDIIHVFFQDDFFTEKHNINGKTCDMLLRKNALESQETQFSGRVLGSRPEGLYDRKWFLYVPVTQFGEKPAIGSMMQLDAHRFFRVQTVEDQMGVYRMELEETG
jgi:hypothetical protein